MAQRLTLSELQRIKQWHVAHRKDHPLEYQLWDGVLTAWMLGWLGWMPAVAMDEWWALPLCAVFIWGPSLYVRWRARAHRSHRLRCDWLA